LDSAQVRSELIRVLKLDLIGPGPGDSRENEILDRAPSREYLTGFLIPFEPPAGPPKQEAASDDTAGEQLDAFSNKPAGDDDQTPEGGSARRAYFPSSMGISVLISKEVSEIQALVEWGDYKRIEGSSAGDGEVASTREQWKRTPRRVPVTIPIGKPAEKPESRDVPESGGLKLVTSIRKVPPSDEPGGIPAELVPSGTRSVSVFLVNYRRPSPDAERDEAFIFQARLILSLKTSFVPRPNLRGLVASTDDTDEQIADLQYRDCFEYAVGHGVATSAAPSADGECREVRTEWVPTAAVEKVEPGEVAGAELSMEALGAIADAATMRAKLAALATDYGAWIEKQRAKIPSDPRRKTVAEYLIGRAQFARGRIEAGIAALDDPVVLDAFRIANRAMAEVMRRRALPAVLDAPAWHPFQLAFILMNLTGIADPFHSDRNIVDLLFFPTGGGKTEAYLGLAAFTLVLRRLRNPGISSAGVSVLMRYTLRLLTLEQLARAATMICALELEREKDVAKLGQWPFEIGLWVGMAATPNRMGRKGEPDQSTARARTLAFKNDDHRPSPIPLENCPWCGQKFTRNSFYLKPNSDQPQDLKIVCVSRDCAFKGDRALPIVAIDQPLYRRLPCFVVATVDKFAGLPWVGHIGALFGKVERYDREGFYGPCDPAGGAALEKPLLPPDLIIQDELHLISGPLGTMAGLYETAVDALSTREVSGKRVGPKIVASTATVRRADAQVRALFARSGVEVFPPPGIDRRDSFFALTVPASTRNPRLYTGIAAQGRSLKVVLLRSYLALLAAVQRMYAAEGGDKSPKNPADPYMTLVGYFGSLRELGGSRRIIEDEVNSRLQSYGSRKRIGEPEALFADRKIAEDVVELTSRESTDKVTNAKRRLALAFSSKERVDVAIATNMISVGLDITRLGLMVVLGQPKTTAEYIQATSRVGRDDSRPGLVVTLLNIHRPRDRSHYERFEAYHSSFYRGVEATSVTPFSPRAIDRGLAAVTVALARHGLAALTAPRHAAAILQERSRLEFVPAAAVARIDPRLPETEAAELNKKLTGRINDLLDEWEKIAHAKQQVGSGLQYQSEEGGAPPLLFDPLDPELEKQPAGARKFKAQRSMRDVEANVNLWVRRLDGIEVESEQS
jgi:Helicase conserved C-terminal domain